jgi:hypothetical protein
LHRRAAVAPARLETGRPELPAQIPAAIAEAHAAQKADAEFSFAAIEPAIPAVEIAPAKGGDEFNFFSDHGD